MATDATMTLLIEVEDDGSLCLTVQHPDDPERDPDDDACCAGCACEPLFAPGSDEYDDFFHPDEAWPSTYAEYSAFLGREAAFPDVRPFTPLDRQKFVAWISGYLEIVIEHVRSDPQAFIPRWANYAATDIAEHLWRVSDGTLYDPTPDELL